MTNNNRIYRRDQLRFLTADVNRILAKAKEIQKDFLDDKNSDENDDKNGYRSGAKEDLDRAISHLNKAFHHLGWTLAGEMDPWD